ncbi:ROK family protein [Candidatus Kaiserbacteria bacterium]|nr:ROK family protein [Candidatus Kaiserbacteria bacterium]NCT01751.1 ROK family protein [Candidatus Parcubacteria bacterium]
MTYILFDIGGTKTRVAVSEDLESIIASESFNTPILFHDGIKKIIATIKKLTKKTPIAMAGGIRGPLLEDKSGIQNDAVLNNWINKSVVAALQEHFSIPVYLENDTAVAGLGEAIYGAGKGLEIIAYHSISTGVGGVKIVNGAVDLASVGFEPGHQIVDIDRTILGDDISPTLENLVSGTAVKNRFGVEPYEIPQTDVVWDELAEYLAQGLRNTILYWSPDAIILGGSMILGDPRISIDTIRKYTVAALNGFVPAPFITTAKMGDEAGLYGAMAILKQYQ